MSKTCLVVWILIFASALWVTGLTIGIIGAVKWPPLKPFLDNAKTTTCTLVDYQYTPKRCAKWGTCLTTNWIVTHPGLRDSATTVRALVIDKEGMGYNDASKLALTRKTGDAVSCWIDSRNETVGYFKKPGGGYFAELVIGWIFFFIGTLIWIFFFLIICDVQLFKYCTCKCKCGRKPSYASSTPNPLYTSGSAYGTPMPGTGNRKISYSGSASSSPRSSIGPTAELEVIQPAGAGGTYATPEPPKRVSDSESDSISAGSGAGNVRASLSSSSSSNDNDYGAGAGVAN